MAISKRKNKDGTVSYDVRIRDYNGTWFPVKSYSRKVDAEAYEREVLNLRDSGATAATQFQKNLTVYDYIENWKIVGRSKVSKGWKMSQDQMIRDYIIPVIGSLKLGSVRASDVRKALQRMEAIGHSSQHRRHVYNLLHKIFDCAANYDQIIAVNPVSKHDRPEVPLVERTALKPVQAKLLLQRARHSPVGLAIWIGMMSALRPSEIQGLKWGAIDFEQGLIHIKAAYKRKTRTMEPWPKQKKHGSSPIVPALREYLIQQSTGKKPADFVVRGIDGEMLSHSTFLRQLKAMCRELRIPVITPHALRHSCTEIWLEYGACEEDIIRLLNQSGAASVRRYIHKTPDRLLQLAKEIDFGHVKTGEERALRVVK